MIAELAQLASKKLTEARAQAVADIQHWQEAANAVATAEQQSQHSIPLPVELARGPSAAASQIKTADYLTVLRIDEQAVLARERILAVGHESLQAADTQAQAEHKQAQNEFSSFVLPKRPNKMPAALVGGFIGVCASLVELFNRQLSKIGWEFVLTPVVLPLVGIVLSRSVWFYGCATSRRAARARFTLRTSAAEADRARIQAARLTLDAEVGRVPRRTPTDARRRAAPGDEQSVVLLNPRDKTIPVLKVVRTWTGMSLEEAKSLLGRVPQVVKAGLTPDQAEKLLRELVEQGASAEIIKE